jgi:DNA-binding MarR family transcriptional regulator
LNQIKYRGYSRVEEPQISDMIKSTMGTNRSHTSKRALAAEVWRLMADFSSTNFRNNAQAELMAEMGLTPAHFRALSILDPEEPRPMRAMASALCCDASMATWLVDRLEERGLAERRTPPNDRRVKTVVLTPLGIKTRERLRESFYDPPAPLMDLAVSSLQSLRDELEKLAAPPKDQGRVC